MNKIFLSRICTFSLVLITAMATLTACSNDHESNITSDNASPKGRTVRISAVVDAVASRTTYADDAPNRKLNVSWEATEKLTVISIGEAGITAIDEFTSNGTAGREVAEFTGTFNGNAGDKVVCLYPSIATPAGQARFGGVNVGASQIELNFPAHSPSTDVNTLKDWDVMVGTTDINESTASVRLYRQISILKLGVQGVYPWDGQSGSYIVGLGVSATDALGIHKAFASHGTMNTTKAGFTPKFTPDAYYTGGQFVINQQTQAGEFMYYIPIFGNQSLTAGDKLRIDARKKERWGYGRWQQFNTDKTFVIPEGKTMHFQPGTLVVTHVTL